MEPNVLWPCPHCPLQPTHLPASLPLGLTTGVCHRWANALCCSSLFKAGTELGERTHITTEPFQVLLAISQLSHLYKVRSNPHDLGRDREQETAVVGPPPSLKTESWISLGWHKAQLKHYISQSPCSKMWPGKCTLTIGQTFS